MSLIEGLLIFFAIVIIYFLIVSMLNRAGILKKYNISPYGPALLLRTTKGRNFLKKIASKKRFWKAYGSFAVVFCFIVMIFMVTIFIWQAIMLLELNLSPAEKAFLPGPEIALALPGINPILPIEYIGYIILALAIAIIVHEFSHGILTFAGKLKVKSLGILYLIVPIGAFCEPDEKQLKKTTTAKRMRVFAAGPMSNFVVTFIVILIFSFIFMSALQPLDGAEVLSTLDDTPGEEINIPAGARIINFNDSKVDNINDFEKVIDDTQPNQRVNISYIIDGSKVSTQVRLMDVYSYFINQTDEKINESYKNDSFLGIRFTPREGFINSLKNPFTYDFPNGFITLYALPLFGYIQGYNPIASPFKENYEIIGPLSVLPDAVFWGIVIALYWIFWLNLAVAVFNVFPIVPLDGGFLFSDAVSSFIKRIKKNITDEKREKIVRNISIFVSLSVLFLVLFPFFIKYI